MKDADLIALALAGVAVWMILASRTAAGAVISAPTSRIVAPGLFASEVNNPALPGQSGYGWTYFDSGTAISPAGEYYYQGRKVWQP
jgi:hypothetical protein